MAPADEEIVALLTEGRTHREVAEQLGISTKTIQRRMGTPAFRDEVERLRRARLAARRAKAEALEERAFEVLEGLLESHDDRVSGQNARWMLDFARKLRLEEENEYLRSKLDELERVLERTSARDHLGQQGWRERGLHFDEWYS